MPVLALIRANMPEGYEEVIAWGMPTWQVPLSHYPDTYNGQPFLYAGLANRKGHCALYLSAMAGFPEVEAAFVQSFSASGKTLNMGASCVRFKSVDQIDLASIAAAIHAIPMADCIANAKAMQAAKRKR
ncbi:MAG: DUF1801 domain-containing protein [Rhizobiaceae bacterium]|nr:DUF1801 domain-containing protein [Rhizobiaceae bacterium]